MALKDKKISDAGINQHGVIAAPDHLTGTAAENKRVFDNLVRALVAQNMNSVIDELTGNGGASEIGVSPVAGVDGTTVQTVLSALGSKLEKRINEAGVASFNGRVGLVMPQSGDYTAAMVGAAPAGYGLGENSIYVDDCNSAVVNGFYCLSSGALNCPSKIPLSDYGVLFVHTRGSIVYQKLSFNGRFACRNGNSYTREWGEWEYENPTMEPNKEYRTTERYNGKPVYVKAINCGGFSAGDTKKIETGINKPVSVAVFNETNAYHTMIPQVSYNTTANELPDSNATGWYWNGGNLYIVGGTGTGSSELVVYAIIKYIKD